LARALIEIASDVRCLQAIHHRVQLLSRLSLVAPFLSIMNVLKMSTEKVVHVRETNGRFTSEIDVAAPHYLYSKLTNQRPRPRTSAPPSGYFVDEQNTFWLSYRTLATGNVRLSTLFQL
jgi:hypothetical protein